MKSEMGIKKMNSKGFTLVELLVVVSIMSILTVITLAQFQSAQRKARDVQRKSDVSGVSKALMMYFNDYGVFPPANANGEIDGVAWGGEFADASGYVYMKVMPKEKDGKPPYCYTVTADRKKFGVFSILENDQDNDYNRLNGGTNYSCDDREDYNFAILSPNAAYSEL